MSMFSPFLDQIESKKIISKQYIVDTVYIGGGTPSILPEEQIGKILGTLRNTFKISDDAEITIEANPGTLDGSKLAAYRAYGRSEEHTSELQSRE